MLIYETDVTCFVDLILVFLRHFLWNYLYFHIIFCFIYHLYRCAAKSDNLAKLK